LHCDNFGVILVVLVALTVDLSCVHIERKMAKRPIRCLKNISRTFLQLIF